MAPVRTRAAVPRLLGVDAGKVCVLPNGIDLDAVARLTPPAPRDHAERLLPALRGAPLVLLSVGRLEAYKGFLTTADALGLLEARGTLPAGWAWVVVGGGPQEAALRARLPGRLHLTGRVDEAALHALYERADVFVHATRFEGSSLVTLEAMAHALPVVATRAGGIPDKVVEGETGALAEPGDAAGLAAALAPLLGDAERRAAWGREGRARVEQRFAWSVLVERVLRLYEELRAAAR